MANLILVDDDEDFVNAASLVLRRQGHNVQCECNFNAAMSRLEEAQPDLIILDVMFPENDSGGFDLARNIRRYSKLKNVPILIVSAINSRFDLGFSTRDIDEEFLPVSDIMEKPVDLKVLCNRVHKLLGSCGSIPRPRDSVQENRNESSRE